MPDKPDPDKENGNSEQFLNVRMQGRITLVQETDAPQQTIVGPQPTHRSDQQCRIGSFAIATWHVIAWPIYWLFRKSRQYPEAMTAFATFWIALFTIVLAGTAIQQWRESDREFRTTQRAQMVLGNERGVLMELKDFGDKTKLVIYMRNNGLTSAQDVTDTCAVIYAPPAFTLQYNKLFPAAGTFETGPTVGHDVPLATYTDIDKTVASEVKNGQLKMRVVGRMAYRDQFASYCEPFSADYETDPSRFEVSWTPPADAVCKPNSTDSETFSLAPDGHHIGVTFHLQRGEKLSPDQPDS